MRARTARRQMERETRKETPKWLLDLELEVKELGSNHQFGTMLERIHTASATHGVAYEELCRTVARLALDLGHVRPLPMIPQGAPLND
jgi:hypothetical protein